MNEIPKESLLVGLESRPCFFFFTQLNFLFLKIYFYLFLSALGLCCCAQAFSSCGERGLLFVAVHKLLIVVVSLVAEHRLQARRLQ